MPVEPHGIVLDNHSVAVDDAGVIVAVVPTTDAKASFSAAEEVPNDFCAVVSPSTVGRWPLLVAGVVGPLSFEAALSRSHAELSSCPRGTVGNASCALPVAQVDLGQHVLLPGLINAHTHISMNVFRGLADDLRLIDWLTQEIWPTEAKMVCPELCRLGSRHAMAEMIRSGTTCFNDMYFFPDATAEVSSGPSHRLNCGGCSTWAPTVAAPCCA